MFLKNIIYLSVISVLVYCSHFILISNSLPKLKISKQNSALNINPFIKFFIAGQNRVFSDLVWIMTLIEGDLEHFKDRSSGSWMFYRFNSITELDPLFLHAYTIGGKYLNIVKDDLYGSEKIFLKGLRRYPLNYDLNYNIAFLYAFELEEYKKAAEYYKKILHYPQVPEFIKTLVVRLEYQHKPDLNISFKSLFQTYNNEPDGTALKEKMHLDLYSIKAQIDLECLNSKNNNCSHQDFEGNPYIQSNGHYMAPKEFKKFKFFKR